MSSYVVTVGLEIHAELHTKSKMWCGCANNPEERRPNWNVCEVCMAHPGTLPVANKEAIKKVIQVGLAVARDGETTIADFTEFDRKNYFYPDIPKGYQLSQYKYPIVTGGVINGIPLTRIHLEEDTAKSYHDNTHGTLIDFNRAGLPLMELVTDPVVYDSKEAAAEASGEFGRELQRILRFLGASEANMEKGQMRVEANISVSKDRNVYGTKCEVKNLNSFRSVEEAIKHEVDRHIEILESGGSITQETRGWDEVKMETFSQRKKENAHDYRYFPDPDLPKFYLSKLFDIETLRRELPELPKARLARLRDVMGITNKEITDVLLDDVDMAHYFDEVTSGKGKAFAMLAANYLVIDTVGLLKKRSPIISSEDFPHPASFSELLEMIERNELSSRGAKDILPEILGGSLVSVKEIAQAKGLIQTNDKEALKAIARTVLTNNPKQVADYKSGKEAMFMYFVGQCMKESKGAGNPSLFQEILRAELGQ